MRRDLPLTPDPRGGLEMGLLRMLAFQPASKTPSPSPTASSPSVTTQAAPAPNTNQGIGDVTSTIEPSAEIRAKTNVPSTETQSSDSTPYKVKQRPPNNPASAALAAARDALQNPNTHTPMVAEPEMAPISTAQPRSVEESNAALATQKKSPVSTNIEAASHDSIQPQTLATTENWATIVEQLKVGGMTRQLAMHCTVQSHQNHQICLCLAPSHEQFINSEREQQLRLALSNYFTSNTTTLQISVGRSQIENPMQIQQRVTAERQQAAEESIRNDATVQTMQQTFSAEITTESIRPI